STWLRDYLFIPLGGSRGGAWRTARNLLITMTVAGLWHGAAWTFVAFGVLQGLLLTLQRVFGAYCSRHPRLDTWLQGIAGTALRRVVTFAAVCGGYILFRASDFAHAGAFLRQLVVWQGGLPAPVNPRSFWCLAGAFALAHVIGHRALWQRWAR